MKDHAVVVVVALAVAAPCISEEDSIITPALMLNHAQQVHCAVGASEALNFPRQGTDALQAFYDKLVETVCGRSMHQILDCVLAHDSAFPDLDDAWIAKRCDIPATASVSQLKQFMKILDATPAP